MFFGKASRMVQHICTDYRCVSAVTVPNCFPMPRMEDCFARFVSKLDLFKGCWQVPLTHRASEISAFVTPDCFFNTRLWPLVCITLQPSFRDWLISFLLMFQIAMHIYLHMHFIH